MTVLIQLKASSPTLCDASSVVFGRDLSPYLVSVAIDSIPLCFSFP